MLKMCDQDHSLLFPQEIFTARSGSTVEPSTYKGGQGRLYSPTTCKRAAWKWHLSALLWEGTDAI